MRSSNGRAVVAAALPKESDAVAAMLRDSGFSEVVCVDNGLAALEQIRLKPTDVLVADMVLPVLDGVSLMKRVRMMSLEVQPALVLAAFPGMCPEAGDAMLEKPVREEALLDALERLDPLVRPAPEEIRLRANEIFESLGMPEHCGRDYLVRAVGIVWLDRRKLRCLTTHLYPAVGSAFGKDRRHVERAMRHAIDEAWKSGEMDNQYRIFGDTIDAKRGSPTCGEMIARIADILRWEGKA